MSAEAYNSLIMDQDATEKAEAIGLKQNIIPSLHKLLADHGVDDLLEIHLLHRHFALEEGEALVHRSLDITGSASLPTIRVDVAKALICPRFVHQHMVPLLWMASPNGSLVAYEYGLQDGLTPATSPLAELSTEKWAVFARAFSTFVHR